MRASAAINNVATGAHVTDNQPFVMSSINKIVSLHVKTGINTWNTECLISSVCSIEGQGVFTTKRMVFAIALILLVGNGCGYSFSSHLAFTTRNLVRGNPNHNEPSAFADVLSTHRFVTDRYRRQRLPLHISSSFSSSSINNHPVHPQSADILQDPEFASLCKGQMISIQVGDISQARKAWKKRRRRDSPLLIPCTILGLDRLSLLRCSIIHLVHAFGKNIHSDFAGVSLSISSLNKLYMQHFYGDLNIHAQALNHESILSLVQHFFNSSSSLGDEDEYGMRLINLNQESNTTDPSDTSVPYLASTLSYRPARKLAQESIYLQFVASSSSDMMTHTGYTALVNTSTPWITKKDPILLSAALKVSQVDADARHIQEGMILDSVFVVSFDLKGDNEAPLLTCAINLPNSLVRDQMKRRYHVRNILSLRQKNHYDNHSWSSSSSSLSSSSQLLQVMGKGAFSNTHDRDIKFDIVRMDNKYTILDICDLQVGDGPFKATVLRIIHKTKNRKSPEYASALVDLGVSRKRGKNNGGGRARVFGLLVDGPGDVDIDREFPPCDEVTEEEEHYFENDNEQIEISDVMEEDLTTLFSVDDEGNLVSLDGSSMMTDSDMNESETLSDEDDYDDFPALQNMNSLERLEYIGKKFQSTVPFQTLDKSTGIQVGDEIDVFIKAIFLQSGRFMVTQDSNVKNTTYNKVKKLKEAEKRLNRLNSKVSLSKIANHIGEECIARIKAKSKSGLGFYVVPENYQGGALIAGLATLNDTDVPGLQQGARVRIRLNAIDEKRGQLSYSLLGPA